MGLGHGKGLEGLTFPGFSTNQVPTILMCLIYLLIIIIWNESLNKFEIRVTDRTMEKL